MTTESDILKTREDNKGNVYRLIKRTSYTLTINDMPVGLYNEDELSEAEEDFDTKIKEVNDA